MFTRFISLVRLSLWADGLIHRSLTAPEILYLTIAYDWLLFSHLLADRQQRGEDIFYFCFYFLQFIYADEFNVNNTKQAGYPHSTSDPDEQPLFSTAIPESTGRPRASTVGSERQYDRLELPLSGCDCCLDTADTQPDGTKSPLTPSTSMETNTISEMIGTLRQQRLRAVRHLFMMAKRELEKDSWQAKAVDGVASYRGYWDWLMPSIFGASGVQTAPSESDPQSK
jgi:hypothetical protein